MSHLPQTPLSNYWQTHQAQMAEGLRDAFIRHAIDNRGVLTSTRQANAVSRQVGELAFQYITNGSKTEGLVTAVQELADKGFAMVTATAMMRALGQIIWGDPSAPPELRQKLGEFQLDFLETLSHVRRLRQYRSQEKTQLALQQALQTQLAQQRELRLTQERYTNAQREILALTGRLAEITEERTLLKEAVDGIRQALKVDDVTFYERQAALGNWEIHATSLTADDLQKRSTPTMINRLEKARTQGGEWVEWDEVNRVLYVVAILSLGKDKWGAMVAGDTNRNVEAQEQDAILLRTFTQGFASLWRNARLLEEAQTRAHELEILYGRYIDRIWSAEATAFQAMYDQNGFQMDREGQIELPADDAHALPITMGDHVLGQVMLPKEAMASAESEFIQALVREMGNALNNTYLLQTARFNSNQLNLATEVSSAATTILDRDMLIKEVVQLIRDRFNLYYVGLFLVDDKVDEAVLKAGTGEAGRLQIERGHKHVIGGFSMIGTSIATGMPIIEQDVTKARAFKFNPLLPNTKAEIALPLRTRGRVIGALTIQSLEKNAFNTETVSILQTLADQLAIAIENAGLFDQTQQTLAETSRLYQTSRQITEAKNQQEVYATLVEFAEFSEIVDAVQLVLVSPDEPDYLYTPTWWSREPLPFPPTNLYPISKFPFLKRLQKNELILIDDVATEIEPFARPPFEANKIQSCAMIPIYIEGRLLASWLLHRQRPLPFDMLELQPFRTLADQTAVILANQTLLDEMQAVNTQLRQLDQLKTQFLANMSHELRTPLNSIIGFSKVMLKGIDGPITAEQEEDLTSINKNGQHLLSLINEILDMAKIEAGKMSLTFERMSIEDAAKTAFSAIRAIVKEGVELIWDVEPDLPKIEADTIRLRQILMNLLSNAAKYTEHGSVRLRIFKENDTHIHLSVHDTGIGISQEDFAVLFKAFEQVDNSTTRVVGGTGLGLPITKWMVTMHQGNIWAESEVGKGSVFHVTLPIDREPDSPTELTFNESLKEVQA